MHVFLTNVDRTYASNNYVEYQCHVHNRHFRRFRRYVSFFVVTNGLCIVDVFVDFVTYYVRICNIFIPSLVLARHVVHNNDPIHMELIVVRYYVVDNDLLYLFVSNVCRPSS